MITAKTPLRISYIGGGSDFQDYFQHRASYVLGTSVNKFVYTSVNSLEPWAEQKFRVTYRQVDNARNYDEIAHPIVREVLRHFNVEQPLNISTLADLPGQSGLGSSSAFTVSFISVLNEHLEIGLSNRDIADLAITIEREILNEKGGVQDQYHSSIGGFRCYKFFKDRKDFSNILLSKESREFISDRQWLIPIGGPRESSRIQKLAIPSLSNQTKSNELQDKFSEAAKYFYEKLKIVEEPNEAFDLISLAVDTSWEIKRTSNGVSTTEIDSLYDLVKNAGATSAKLCGAGGSGFLLVMSDGKFIDNLPNHFDKNSIINVRIIDDGSATFRI